MVDVNLSIVEVSSFIFDSYGALTPLQRVCGCDVD